MTSGECNANQGASPAVADDAPCDEGHSDSSEKKLEFRCKPNAEPSLLELCRGAALNAMKLEFMLLFLEKGTTGSNTLIVLFIVLTYHHRFFHFHIEKLFDIIYGRQNG